MLLSMYVSYQLANRNKIIYVLSMIVFVVLASFLSTRLPINMIGIILVFPLVCWSFPFYAYITPIFSLEQYYWVEFYKVRFLTVDLTSAFSLGRGLSYPSFPLSTAIPIFLLVNVVGVILGYGLSRITRIREWGNKRTWNLMGFFLGVTFSIIGRLLVELNRQIVVNGRIVRPEGLYIMDGGAIFHFGIIILLIAIGKILWGLKNRFLEEFSENIELE